MRKFVTLVVTVLAFVLLSTNSFAEDLRRPCGPNNRVLLRLFIPQSVFGANFRPACWKHDDAYNSSGISKADSDQVFLADLLCACEHSLTPRLCSLL